jgi:hypothetical protein
MELYTTYYLRNKVKNLSSTDRQRLFSQSINESQKNIPSFDIFLSHSFLDKEDVYGLYIELTEKGYTVYVDWIVDPQLDRSNVTKESANLIRNRMKSCKSLLLAISEKASVSKWMPWELGYVDGKTNNCAIVPVSDQVTPPTSYKGSEYLSLYPYVAKASDYSLQGKAMVVEDTYNYVELNEMVQWNRKPYARMQRI